MGGGVGEDTRKCQGGEGKNGRELGIRTQFSRVFQRWPCGYLVGSLR